MAPELPSPERWSRIERILDAVLDAPTEARDAILESACEGDPELREEVERLLKGCDREHGFLETPAGLPTSKVGRYEVERVIGRGGMGVVYLARDPRLERRVALKLLPPFLSLDPEAKRRLIEEAKAASSLDHPCVATVFEFDEDAGGRLFIVMPYYEGVTLARRLRGGPMTVEETVDLASRIAEGLAAVHDAGVLHRDIKPSNIIITRDGVPKIVDFGLAKAIGAAATRQGVTIGTVAYMSPEQTRGSTLDERSDLWSLGVVMYEMLAGRHPFGDARDAALVHAIRDDEPEPLDGVRPELPAGLSALVHRLLTKDPDGRVPSARALLTELARFRGSELPARFRATATRSRSRPPVPILGAIAALAAIMYAIFALSTGRGRAGAGTAADSSTIAVLPLVPAADDSALERLGRELAVTLSAGLDGIGEIRTTPALAVLARADDGALSVEEGARVASRLGASTLVQGTLVRSGDAVRLDLVLAPTDAPASGVRATARGPIDDLIALSDSASIALLRLVWKRGPAPVRSLSEVTTRSLPALRAFVGGEAAFARGAFREAIGAYERAFDEDSTFWFAYWRSLYPRAHVGLPPDSGALAAVFAHRDRLPERERLLVESYHAPTLEERIARLRRFTRRFPNYWPGWWEYGEELLHRGPYVGTTHADADSALAKVVELNPRFAAGWEHLFWVSVLRRDTARAAAARGNLEAFAAPGAVRYNSDMLAYLEALDEVIRNGGELSDAGRRRVARTAQDIHAGGGPVRAEGLATGFVSFGFPRAQLQFAAAVEDAGAEGELAAYQAWGRALAFAIRGAWDRSLAEAARWVRATDDPSAGLRAYGLATVGAWLGGVSPEAAVRHRPLATSSAGTTTPTGRAEIAWLDGVLAYTRGDVRAIEDAMARIHGSGADRAPRLERSLGAFRLDATGERARAADALASLEEETATGLDSRYRATQRDPSHPSLAAVDRLAAGRWLVASGDTVRAARLLTWHEAVGPMHRSEQMNRVVEPLALLERARIAHALGEWTLAHSYYTGFLARYDMPPSSHAALVEEAIGASRALAAGSRP